MFDAVIALVGCDKTRPGAALALIRLNVPGFLLYGGSIAPGRFKGRDVTVVDVYEAIGANAAGRVRGGEPRGLENSARSRGGAGGGPFTTNHTSSAVGVIWLSPLRTA